MWPPKRSQRLDEVSAEVPRAAKQLSPLDFLPHKPTAKQRQFLALTCLEALYGGAAGGGKTDALLMAAAQYIHVPGYAALILRRTYQDLALPGAIMDRAKQWWLGKQGVAWNDKDKRFTFPSGATITFGYLDTEQDKFRYQGAELQFIGFDELTQFPEAWYTYLLSRLRRLTGTRVPLRARAASNPGGIGHDWVKKRFVDHTDAMGPRFVPAVLADNPHLDAVAYRAALDLLDPITRRQLLEGVWLRDGGGLVYGHFDENRSLIASAPESLTIRMLGLDFGIDDQNACTVLGWRDHDPCVYILESYRITATVRLMTEEVKRLEDTYHFAQIVGDTGGMGKAFTTDVSAEYGITVKAAEKQNKVGYVSAMNSRLADGRIKVVAPKCKDLLDEWRTLPWNEARTKEAEGFANHASDSALYVWRATSSYHEQPLPPEPVLGSPEYYAAQQSAIIEAMEKDWERKQRMQWWEQ